MRWRQIYRSTLLLLGLGWKERTTAFQSGSCGRLQSPLDGLHAMVSKRTSVHFLNENEVVLPRSSDIWQHSYNLFAISL